MKVNFQRRLFILASVILLILTGCGLAVNYYVVRNMMLEKLHETAVVDMSACYKIYRSTLEQASYRVEEIAKDAYFLDTLAKVNKAAHGIFYGRAVEDYNSMLMEYYGMADYIEKIYTLTDSSMLFTDFETQKTTEILTDIRRYGDIGNLADFIDTFSTQTLTMGLDLNPYNCILLPLDRKGSFIVAKINTAACLDDENEIIIKSLDGTVKARTGTGTGDPEYGEEILTGKGFKVLKSGERETFCSYYNPPGSSDVLTMRQDFAGMIGDFYTDALFCLYVSLGICGACILIYYAWSRSIMKPLDNFRYLMDSSRDISTLNKMDVLRAFPARGYNFRGKLYRYFLSLSIPLAVVLLIAILITGNRMSEQSQKYYHRVFKNQAMISSAQFNYCQWYARCVSSDTGFRNIMQEYLTNEASETLSYVDKSRMFHRLFSHASPGTNVGSIRLYDSSGRVVYASDEDYSAPGYKLTRSQSWRLGDGIQPVFVTGVYSAVDETGREIAPGYISIEFYGLFNKSNAFELAGIPVETFLSAPGGIYEIYRTAETAVDIPSVISQAPVDAKSYFDVATGLGGYQASVFPMSGPGWKLVYMLPSRWIFQLVSVDSLWVGFAMLGVALLVSAAVGPLVTESLLTPMRMLRKNISSQSIMTHLDETLYGTSEFKLLAQSYNRMLDRINAYSETLRVQEERRQHLENRRRDAELIALQTQINPHFLYNIFTSIAVLIKKGSKEDAVQMVMATGNLMRLGVYKGTLVVPLSEEIEHVRQYIKLQQIRHRNQIAVEWDVPRDMLSLQVVKFICQPLIENAIEHGMGGREDRPIRIRVSAYREKKDLRIIVDDDGVGMKPEELAARQQSLDERTQSPHMGLFNVNERIKLNCGDEYGLTLAQSPLEGLRVIIRLPVKE